MVFELLCLPGNEVVLQQVDNHLTLPEDTEAQIPLRPLNSCIGSPTYELSKYLAYILKHLANETEYSVENAQQFAAFVSNQEVAKDKLLVSFDVISLFTSIPIGMAIEKSHTAGQRPNPGLTLLSPTQQLFHI